jgi:hypothetical protein
LIGTEQFTGDGQLGLSCVFSARKSATREF